MFDYLSIPLPGPRSPDRASEQQVLLGLRTETEGSPEIPSSNPEIGLGNTFPFLPFSIL